MAIPFINRKRKYISCWMVVTICTLLYIVVFNIAAFYSLFKSSETSHSPWLKKKGHLYLGHLKEENFSCKTISFSRTRLPLTALASFPGSGNTWIRHIVQEATGIATGSQYSDEGLRRLGFPGEGWTNGSVLMVKTHESSFQERAKYQKAVVLIRSPFDAILAEFNRKYGGHMGHAQKQDFIKYWEEHAKVGMRNWFYFYEDWMKFNSPLHVIQFEKVRQNPRKELVKLLNFLKIRIPAKDQLCVLKNLEGKYKRFPLNNYTRERLYPRDLKYSILHYQTNLVKLFLSKQNVSLEFPDWKWNER